MINTWNYQSHWGGCAPPDPPATGTGSGTRTRTKTRTGSGTRTRTRTLWQKLVQERTSTINFKQIRHYRVHVFSCIIIVTNVTTRSSWGAHEGLRPSNFAPQTPHPKLMRGFAPPTSHDYWKYWPGTEKRLIVINWEMLEKAQILEHIQTIKYI